MKWESETNEDVDNTRAFSGSALTRHEPCQDCPAIAPGWFMCRASRIFKCAERDEATSVQEAVATQRRIVKRMPGKVPLHFPEREIQAGQPRGELLVQSFGREIGPSRQ